MKKQRINYRVHPKEKSAFEFVRVKGWKVIDDNTIEITSAKHKKAISVSFNEETDTVSVLFLNYDGKSGNMDFVKEEKF
jgi:hypothetical protein